MADLWNALLTVKAEWVSALTSVILAILTFWLAALTRVLARETRRTREANERADVQVSVGPQDEHVQVIELVIANVGKASAHVSSSGSNLAWPRVPRSRGHRCRSQYRRSCPTPAGSTWSICSRR